MSYVDGSTVFLLSVTGQISKGTFPSRSDLYCRHCFVAGPDWAVTNGQEEGISQITRVSQDSRHLFVWNFPLDVTFRSTCPFGWPQLVVSVYEIVGGHEAICGYGSIHVPITPGSHSAKIPVFAPQPSSIMQRIGGYFLGKRPEFIDPRVVATGDGRDVTRVRSCGWIMVNFNVMTKDLRRLGYSMTPRGATKEIRNKGPSQGLGMISKIAEKKDDRILEHVEEDDQGEEENEEDDETGGIEMRAGSKVESAS